MGEETMEASSGSIWPVEETHVMAEVATVLSPRDCRAGRGGVAQRGETGDARSRLHREGVAAHKE